MATTTPDPSASFNTNANNTANDAAAFRKFDDYPWVRDKSFLQGLVAMLGPLSNGFERQKALGVTLQARIWWYKSRIGLDVDRSAYETWYSSSSSSSSSASVDSTLLDKVEELQRRLGIASSSSSPEQQRQNLPAWMVEAPQKVDLRKKADDGQEEKGNSSSQDAPYPAHFQAIIEAVTTGKAVPGVREIPNTVIRQPGILPVGKMQAPRKPWERQQQPQQVASPDESPASFVTAGGGRLLDEEFPPVPDATDGTSRSDAPP
ncbi:hypothetical protein QBC47DRAFT_369461 [Echria macrotheca]|uniref:Uncharacterized protein n=1 Tax=Echria macrotheca TaxID=438768 RepID=A0AAJ0BQN3_9PEZI|nr:hypothetical protein QBC47DRAFT_369461 [Echria macrotheca]